MRHRLHARAPGLEDAPGIVVAAAMTAGGSQADGIVLAGLPPAALRLLPCEAGVVVEPAVAGARVGGHPVPPGARRLLRPGERATLLGAELALATPEPGPGTSADHRTRTCAAGILRAGAAGGAAAAGPHLLVLDGASAGARLPLGPDQTLGRSRRADLRLPEAQASRLHARVRVRGGAITVEDLGAKNGLRVNGVAVERGPRALAPGDELELGGCALALVVPPAAPGPPARAAPPAPARPRARALPRLPRLPRRLAAVLLALSALALAAAGS
ncbi:FHA domain containing protein [Anaeromyxobacter sp. K]|uniref:FHA domain-containing protein n=1 Tax=Anaeromyxobacter sp. (strain K) TaxID=447217 RepID=UPI00015F9E9D|nr:FHA domain-containing protein [Anaeromyxobacter sp. K]ACG73820.1 FHA domain containing protein [Anaeromyxobacter sp. K]